MERELLYFGAITRGLIREVGTTYSPMGFTEIGQKITGVPGMGAGGGPPLKWG